MKGFFGNRGTVIAAIVLLVSTSFFIGTYIGHTYSPNMVAVPSYADISGEVKKVDLSLFWRAWSALEDKYVSSEGVPSDEERIYGAIQGLAESYGDPYTVFFPPVEAKEFESEISGNFEGVGMEVGEKDDVITVIAPLKGTPADRAGVLPGDIILGVNGTSTAGLAVDEVVALIRGPKGSKVTLTLLKADTKKPAEVSIVRDVIDIPTIDTELRKDGVFVISLYNFSANSPALFRNALKEFVLSGSDKLVLDLRGNPGGYLEAAVDIASWFLPEGKVVVTEEGKHSEENIVFRSRGYPALSKNPKFVILVDGGSASASEILAGALKEHGLAQLVGTKTYGKGSVQELIRLTSGTSLKVTVARWLTPNGTSISEGGLAPDVEVAITAEDVEAGRDPQLEKAVELLLQQ